jgi:hypothetical protein
MIRCWLFSIIVPEMGILGTYTLFFVPEKRLIPGSSSPELMAFAAFYDIAILAIEKIILGLFQRAKSGSTRFKSATSRGPTPLNLRLGRSINEVTSLVWPGKVRTQE